MLSKTRSSWIGGVCLAVGVCAGAAGAQVLETIHPVRYVRTGIFSLGPNERATFHVTLDDVRSGAAVHGILSFIDEAGTVVARTDVTLRPGESISLPLEGGSGGRVRGYAELIDRSTQSSARRSLYGAVEVLETATGQRRPTCSVDEGGHSQAGKQ
jgi:hypothetical protein